VEDARALLRRLGAPARLARHVELVGEAADALVAGLVTLRIPHDAQLVRLGVVFHDAGKIAHPAELSAPGKLHEPAGERMLLEAGVAPEVARCCLSHGRWDEMDVSFDELLVALADNLWKGKRNEPLERRVVEGAALLRGVPFWDLFVPMDSLFESIAAGGEDRLARSV